LTKITYLPDKEVIIHRIVEEERDVFLNRVILRALGRRNPRSTFFEPPLVPCVDGIAMSIDYFPETPEVVKKKLQGKSEIWAVLFTRTETGTYSTTIAGNAVEVRLFEAKSDPQLVELAKYLKSFENPKTYTQIYPRNVSRFP
jgi:hypothetical protein